VRGNEHTLFLFYVSGLRVLLLTLALRSLPHPGLSILCTGGR
jgi:hypothetical protein